MRIGGFVFGAGKGFDHVETEMSYRAGGQVVVVAAGDGGVVGGGGLCG